MDDVVVDAAERAVLPESDLASRMRERARERWTATADAAGSGFVTPDWLDRSFVLPVQREREVPVYIRPSAAQVDYALVVRRYDTCARARIATTVTLVLAMLAMVGFEITMALPWAYAAIALGLVSLGTAVQRAVLRRAPIPHRES